MVNCGHEWAVRYFWLPTAVATRRQGQHCRCQRLREGCIGGWLTQLVAARRLGPPLSRDLNRYSDKEQLVDVLPGPVVRTDVDGRARLTGSNSSRAA